MKTLNLRKGQRTKQRNRILVDLISKIWDKKTDKQKNWPYGWIELLYFLIFRQARPDFFMEYNSSIQPYGQFFCFSVFYTNNNFELPPFALDVYVNHLNPFLMIWNGFLTVQAHRRDTIK